MSSVIKALLDDPKNTKGREEGSPPEWMTDSIQYETLMGSKAYGTASKYSDSDIYAWCIPPRECVFPYFTGNIPLFDEVAHPWNVYQLHKIRTQDNEYDINCYSIAHYFGLARNGNPNIIDSLFVDEDDILHMTEIGEMVFRQPTLFISKRTFQRYMNYATREHEALLKWIGNPSVDPINGGIGARKSAYHATRLLLQSKQLMKHGIMELKQDSDLLRSIRDGENLFEVNKRIHQLKEEAQTAYNKSSMRDDVDESAIRSLLISILETQYGTLPTSVAKPLDGLDLLDKHLMSAVNELERLKGMSNVSPS